MAKTLHITVKDKVATYCERDGFIVCGNSDYVIEFTFDREWNAYNTKTARFISKGSYEDVVFTGNTVAVPILRNTDSVLVGVFSGELKTTTSAVIGCRKSILCADGAPANPSEDVYNQIIALLNAGGGGSGGTGKDGVSPIITATNTTTGYLLTITDASGTEYITITNGVSPTVNVTSISGGHRVSITDTNGTHTFDVMDGEDGSGGGSADTSDLEFRIEVLEEQLANALYQPIEITSFTMSPAYHEKGDTVNTVTLNWGTNKTPLQVGVTTSMPLREDELRVDDTGLYVDWISATVNNPVSFSLAATDEKGATATKSVSVTFYNGVYYGALVEPTEYDTDFVRRLTKELRPNKKPSINVTAGEGEYIYYCLPVSMGTCSFTVGGFTGGFELVDTIEFTNAFGYSESYYIYKSDSANLGETSVTII